jgi:hypothetical protein
MGLDFIRRAAPSFEKKWDRGLARLSEPLLFTRDGIALPRTVLAKLEKAAAATVGKEYVLRKDGERLELIDGLQRAGAVSAPPREVLQKIEAAGGCALGKVTVVYPISGSAELELP